MTATFTRPANDRYLEDYVTGDVFEFGRIEVDEDEVIQYASRFDPQPFHTDPEAAKRYPFGGVIASGWHTAGMMMRLVVDHYMSSVAGLASPGVDEVRWPRPVRPGDTLTVRATVLDTRRSRSKPDRGIVRTQFEVLNQRGEVVMSVKAMTMMKAREPQSL